MQPGCKQCLLSQITIYSNVARLNFHINFSKAWTHLDIFVVFFNAGWRLWFYTTRVDSSIVIIAVTILITIH